MTGGVLIMASRYLCVAWRLRRTREMKVNDSLRAKKKKVKCEAGGINHKRAARITRRRGHSRRRAHRMLRSTYHLERMNYAQAYHREGVTRRHAAVRAGIGTRGILATRAGNRLQAY